MLRAFALSVVAATAILFATAAQTHAQILEDTAPTFENGSVDPSKTADPAAVAEAQRALEAFFEYTNREYSPAGFANPREMREELGNRQSSWLDRTLPLACGRLVHGYKGRNWIPGKGWAHEAPRSSGDHQSVPCLFRPPTAGEGGPDPDETIDPPAVAAAQKALAEFYEHTNAEYSIRGYANPSVMRETRGNDGGRWLDQALALARGNFLCGFRCKNWIPNKGWEHEAIPIRRSVSGSSTQADQRNTFGWSADMRLIAGETSAILVPQPTFVTTRSYTPDLVVTAIMQRVAVPVVGEP